MEYKKQPSTAPSSDAYPPPLPHTAHPPESPGGVGEAIDATVFQNFVTAMGGDDEPEWVRDLVETFLDDAARLMEEVRQAVEQQQAAALQAASHSLKSSSAQLGALTLSRLSKELEIRGRSGTLEGTADILGQLEPIYAQAHHELSERLQSL